jgi:hypothetical protein
MMVANLTIELLSDATFGRGEGTAGEVDVEVEHDELGVPFVGGKTVHGLLRDAWLSMARAFPRMNSAALRVLGQSQELSESSIIRVGNATVDETTRQWIRAACTRARSDERLHPREVLRAFTEVRRQTAQDRVTGAPATTTLRAARVVVRGVTFWSPLTWLATPDDDALRCLALCALGVRHAGLSRNRGRGHVRTLLNGDEDLTKRLAREAVR